MIVADTSALVAIGFAEPEPAAFAQALEQADRVPLFSYALTKVRNLPLLYKGGDFSQTDIASAAG